MNNFFKFFKPLSETPGGLKVFAVVNSYFISNDLLRKPCVNICTNGTSIISGSLKGFIALVMHKNHVIVFSFTVFCTKKPSFQNYQYPRA